MLLQHFGMTTAAYMLGTFLYALYHLAQLKMARNLVSTAVKE